MDEICNGGIMNKLILLTKLHSVADGLRDKADELNAKAFEIETVIMEVTREIKKTKECKEIKEYKEIKECKETKECSCGKSTES